MKPRTDPSPDVLTKRVVFDTNALFRFHVRALILYMAQTDALRPLWSARTVEELRGVLAGRGKTDAEDFLEAFPDSTVVTGHGLEGKGFRDPGDLHVVQAAIDGQGMILADDLMQSEIRNRVLTVVSEQQLTGFGYVVMSTAGARKKPAVKKLLEWIISGT